MLAFYLEVEVLVLVEVEGDKVLVGVSPAGISRLWSRSAFAATLNEGEA